MTTKQRLLAAAAFSAVLLPGGLTAVFAQQPPRPAAPAPAAQPAPAATPGPSAVHPPATPQSVAPAGAPGRPIPAPQPGQAAGQQGSGQPGGQQTAGQQDASQDSGGQGSAGDAATLRQSPILAVTSIEVFHSSHGTRVDVIKASGVVSAPGWSTPVLVPLTQGMPSDGILDLVFQAGAPTDSLDAEGIVPVEALLPVDGSHKFKGVRVRSATNAITLKTIPGFVEVQPPKDPCDNCIGKVFVAKGASAPAGVPAGDVVHEQDLPLTTRVIKPTDGVVDLPHDPNRLNLIIGEDGKIIDAAWD